MANLSATTLNNKGEMGHLAKPLQMYQNTSPDYHYFNNQSPSHYHLFYPSTPSEVESTQIQTIETEIPISFVISFFRINVKHQPLSFFNLNS
jgi:hypothetical protein